MSLEGVISEEKGKKTETEKGLSDGTYSPECIESTTKSFEHTKCKWGSKERSSGNILDRTLSG